jgi:hypothetical protein
MAASKFRNSLSEYFKFRSPFQIWWRGPWQIPVFHFWPGKQGRDKQGLHVNNAEEPAILGILQLLKCQHPRPIPWKHQGRNNQICKVQQLKLPKLAFEQSHPQPNPQLWDDKQRSDVGKEISSRHKYNVEPGTLHRNTFSNCTIDRTFYGAFCQRHLFAGIDRFFELQYI